MENVTEREAFHNLANAIIVQAAKEYVSTKNSEEQERIEKFFFSEWFSLLTNLDPFTLIDRLNHFRSQRKHKPRIHYGIKE